jgi:hypothetical protein
MFDGGSVFASAADDKVCVCKNCGIFRSRRRYGHESELASGGNLSGAQWSAVPGKVQASMAYPSAKFELLIIAKWRRRSGHRRDYLVTAQL